MLILEFFGFGLYYDYIHILPLIVAFLIFFTQLESLKPKFVIINIIISCIWIYLAYFWRLAYYDDSVGFLTFKLVIICVVDLTIAFIIRQLQKKVNIEEIT